MNSNVIGVIYTLILIAGCEALAFLFSKKFPELSRKIVHIGVAHWYFIYVNCFTEPTLALIGLLAFAVINAVMNETGLLNKVMGQTEKKKNWGLVWYPISVFIMVLLSHYGVGDNPELGITGKTALGVGLLGMGWGDGLAALVGSKFGKYKLSSLKSLEGSTAFFIAVTFIAYLFTHNIALSVACGVTGALFELTTPHGLDNVTVPLVLYATVAFWPRTAMLPGFAMMAYLAYKLNYLTPGGATGAFILGVLVTWNFGSAGLMLLLLFFVSSTILGKIRKKLQKKEDGFIEKKSDRRDLMQVTANGLMAGVAAIIFAVISTYIKMKPYIAGEDVRFNLLAKIFMATVIMFGAAVAEATSDTWAGELGRLSKRPPVSIKTGKIVQKGVSGGVTLLGYGGGLLGSAFIAVFWYAFFAKTLGQTDAFAAKLPIGITIIELAGFAGCVLDSVLGAFVQALYIDADSGKFSEKPKSKTGKDNQMIQGVKWMDNDMVNLLSNIFSAVAAFAVAMII